MVSYGSFAQYSTGSQSKPAWRGPNFETHPYSTTVALQVPGRRGRLSGSAARGRQERGFRAALGAELAPPAASKTSGASLCRESGVSLLLKEYLFWGGLTKGDQSGGALISRHAHLDVWSCGFSPCCMLFVGEGVGYEHSAGEPHWWLQRRRRPTPNGGLKEEEEEQAGEW